MFFPFQNGRTGTIHVAESNSYCSSQEIFHQIFDPIRASFYIAARTTGLQCAILQLKVGELDYYAELEYLVEY